MDAFFQAAYCQPPRVLGRQLMPFSLSHVFLLGGLGNGFVTTGNGTRSELFTAAMVCSRTHSENARALFGGRGPSLLRLMAWSLRWPDRKIEAEREAFKAYLSDYCTVPEHWQADEGRGFQCPWQFHFVMTLTRYFGSTLEAAWNTPVALARCYYDAWAESEGDKSLVTTDEADKIRWLESQEQAAQ